ncbi:hypothetical protein B7486_58625 [cyanobacterium TDX16]|nr:hypothetical protein B7486_58625 [cyanobacterium TDX16]
MDDLAPRPARVLLALTGVTVAVVGAWASFAPRSFYDDFPGFGLLWVNVDGPYNRHLVTDVGGLQLAVAFLLLTAVVLGSRRLVLVAAATALVTAVPHLTYHLFHRDGYEQLDLVTSLVSLTFAVVLPAVALLLAWPRTSQPSAEVVGVQR